MHAQPTLSLVLLAAFLAGCQKLEQSFAPPGSGNNAGDRDRLQGVWAVESVDTGDPKAKLPPGLKLEDMRTQFVGNEMLVTLAGRPMQRMSFGLQETAEPKVLVITYLGDDGQPKRPSGPAGPIPGGKPAPPRDWIYKFDGEILVVAQPDYAIFYDKPMKRPVDFAPIPSSFKPGHPPVNGVTITRLKKTTEQPVPVGNTKS